MCGIFGLIATSPEKISARTLNQLVRKLFKQSETRGKDASGVLAVSGNEIFTFKQAQRVSQMLKSQHFSEILAQADVRYGNGEAFVVAGHTRMATNGSEEDQANNQPVIKGDLVLLHNGIIVNDEDLWSKNPDLHRQYQVDTEIFGAMLMSGINSGRSLPAVIQDTFIATQGANTVAIIHAGLSEIFLGTTNGSLYFWHSSDLGLTLFGSEEFILNQSLSLIAERFPLGLPTIQQVKRGNLLVISLIDGSVRMLSVEDARDYPQAVGDKRKICQLVDQKQPLKNKGYQVSNVYSEIESHMHHDTGRISLLKRCSKCLLPETFPFINFDAQGVCQYCRQYRPTPLLGPADLHRLSDRVRSIDGRADCLVPISGGRDSCYGLHYIKKELGLNPIAYTYDWGFVTDLARRNISRMCGELNVEHVLVAADIQKKRENVRKNVSAWLNNPNLGMIPLFMAGDKQFFHYATKIKKQMGLGPILFSMNWLERTGFKAGFAGVNDTGTHEKTHGLTLLNQLKLIRYYGYNFLRNPAYINSSLVDTLFGYASFYLKAKDYYQIFDYLRWDQNEVERTIIGDYDWEISPDTKSTWRIGDGTAPFYNYIYLSIAGFTENDTFRSNQIREGMIEREVALKAIEEENRPRPESFKWYCDVIGVDAVAAIKAINNAKKLY